MLFSCCSLLISKRYHAYKISHIAYHEPMLLEKSQHPWFNPSSAKKQYSVRILPQQTPPSMTSREERKSNRRATLQGSMMPWSHQVGGYWTVLVSRAPLHGCLLYLWRSMAFVSARAHLEMLPVYGTAGNCQT